MPDTIHAPMGRPKKLYQTATIRLPNEVVRMLRVIALSEGKDIPDWAMAHWLPRLTSEYARAVKKLAERRGE